MGNYRAALGTETALTTQVEVPSQLVRVFFLIELCRKKRVCEALRNKRGAQQSCGCTVHKRAV